ncbi:ATPase family associated with various cellular activities (AAA) domain-containing protein [Trichoderma breve]|uniref:ATPase family associated with various cellular activities (AAA) domain-containing protein n=1 Tax=Trichoderma breve TaxID=2034170 RepID=A0A9W9JS04_9HYPO|nr:ATPase family associated with various cellular activities (AAA) domain-containing protein [Trichoderma breve]KAJ4865228.1 ATPase family associated with various cellular activities (AAA) domain-containing protein [Trichoderma breve]
MLKKSIDAKVRPLANVSLERASLLGAARIYVSKDSLISLTGGLESGRPCTVESLQTDDSSGDGSAADAETAKRRGASLWVLPEKNISPNVVMMTRAFQEATGFKLGDVVRITLAEPAVIPDAEEVVVQDAASEADQQKDGAADSKHPPSWEFSVSVSLDRAEQVFPGMVLEGVNINKLRRTFKVISVNGQSNNLARFKLSSSTVRIVQPGGVPGLSSQVNTINQFLRGFGRPFWIQNERESCGFVIHGGHGTGKTFILQRIAAINWGRVHWIRPSDKLSSIRETFKQAQSQQPSLLFIDGLEDILAKDRSNRDTVIEALGDELDNLSATASTANALPRVVVIATCLDYLADVPAKLQKRSRFRENVALPIPRATERLEILRFFNPPLQAEEKESCLVSLASKTHAYNGDDLANLVLNAKKILGNRLDEETAAAAAQNVDAGATGESSQETQQPKEHYLTSQDMEQALRITRPTAMHDINLKPPTIHWQDVGGQESLKKVLSRMIKNTKDTNPTSRHVLRQPPKGLLLYGPPGCSKTLSAQAMATESSFNFFAVKGAELLNMYVGESERAVRTLFERARAAAPSIIFFDEIDSIGGSRTGGNGAAAAARSTGSVNMLTTLLTEMDGFESLTGVLVLAATNRPEAMDPALLRPGRFDQILYVGPPDLSAREAVFGVHLRGLALSPDVDISELARITDGYSGAEIKAICNEAGLAVLDRCDEDETGTEKMEITMADLVAAVEKTPRNITAMMISGYEMWSRQFKRL